jgi:hypothetical protein
MNGLVKLLFAPVQWCIRTGGNFDPTVYEAHGDGIMTSIAASGTNIHLTSRSFAQLGPIQGAPMVGVPLLLP